MHARHATQLAQPIRLQMKHLGLDFEEVRYGQRDCEFCWQQLCCYHVFTAYVISVYLFCSADWQDVKETLGMPFPNVSCTRMCVCVCVCVCVCCILKLLCV